MDPAHCAAIWTPFQHSIAAACGVSFRLWARSACPSRPPQDERIAFDASCGPAAAAAAAAEPRESFTHLARTSAGKA